MIHSQLFHKISCFPLEKIFFENYIINVELAQVLQYYSEGEDGR
jgi:hypothetical protein